MTFKPGAPVGEALAKPTSTVKRYAMTLSRSSNVILSAVAAFLAVGGAYSAYGLIAPSPMKLIGIVDANQILISAQTAGRLEKLLVEEGQEVKAGDVIAILDPAELTAAMGSYRAQVDSLENQLNAAKASAVSTVGETWSGLASAQAARDGALASHAEAIANRRKQEDLTQRMITLAKSGAVALQDRDSALRNLEAVIARENVAKNGVIQAEAAVRSAQARTSQGAAAKDTVRSVIGQLASARAQAAEAAARLGYTKVLAPTSGKIGILAARQGEVVSAGGAIATLVDLKQTWVYSAIPETQAGSLKVGDHLMVRMLAGKEVEGKVIVKAGEADFATQRDASSKKRDIKAVKIKLLIGNEDEGIVPGMTAEVIVPVKRGVSR